jgi:hypothetical protein
MTSHRGNEAPMMEPNPAEIYFTPHVDKPFARMKFRKARNRIGSHCFPFGQAYPLSVKKITYMTPAQI